MEVWQRQPLPQLTQQPTKRSTPLEAKLIGSWGIVQTGSILSAFYLIAVSLRSASFCPMSPLRFRPLSQTINQSIIFKSFTTWLLHVFHLLILIRPESNDSFSSPLIGPVIVWLAEDSDQFVKYVYQNPDSIQLPYKLTI